MTARPPLPPPPLPLGMTIDDVPRGIEWTAKGWRVVVRGRKKRFKRTTPYDVVRKFQLDEQARQQLGIDEQMREAARRKTLRDDAHDQYLPTKVNMPTYGDAVRNMEYWCDAMCDTRSGRTLGDVPRADITTLMLRTICAAWLTKGPRRVQYYETDPVTKRKVQKFREVPKALAPQTVNNRLHTLENFFTVMDGLHARNPAREIGEYPGERLPVRAVPIALLEEILAAIPEQGKGWRWSNGCVPSKTKARMAVMIYAGLPPAQIKLLREEDIHVDTQSVRVRWRRKGKGVEGGERPVTKDGIAALKRLVEIGALGSYSQSSVRRIWMQACRVVEQKYARRGVKIQLVGKVRPYDVRHSFVTDALASTRSETQAMLLAGQRDIRTTRRYALGAVDPVLADAVRRIDRYRAKARLPQKAKVTTKVTTVRAPVAQQDRAPVS